MDGIVRIYGDSRLWGVEVSPVATTSKHAMPGATYHIMFDAIKRHHRRAPAKYVVICGGLCDIATRVVDQEINYREVYQQYDSVTLDHIKDTIDRIDLFLRAEGVVPIWATMPPMNFAHHNQYNVSAGRTNKLLYQNGYKSMQTTHNIMVRDVNKYLHRINACSKVATPFLASWVQHFNNGRIEYRWGHLYDGVHPDDYMVQKWGQHLTKVININTTHFGVDIQEH